MWMTLRHLLAILLLPCLVVIVVPYWLLISFVAVDNRWGDGSIAQLIARAAAIFLFVSGFALFGWCVGLFARVGRGTLAPWDPTQKIVAVGPYRFVRNPMISGVLLMLLGLALFWGSWLVAGWACLVFAINHVYFIVSEELGLEERFGARYLEYKATVPRWIPRLKA